MLATEEQTQQADDVLGMIATFYEVIASDRAKETREEAGSLAFWEDYWSRLQGSPLSDPNTISRADRCLDFLHRHRARFGL